MPMPLSGLAQTLSNSVASVQAQIVDTQAQLASGTKTLNPGENGVVTRLSAQATAYSKVLDNISTGLNVITVDQTALTSISSLLSILTPPVWFVFLFFLNISLNILFFFNNFSIS